MTTSFKEKFFKGIPGLKNLITPPGFDRGNPDHLVIGSRLNGKIYCRSFAMTGFPPRVSIGWLDDIINYEGDIDTVIHIRPADTRAALDELTAEITKKEAQLEIEIKRDYRANITRLQHELALLYEQRQKLEQNLENLFYVSIVSNLFSTTLEALNKETTRLTGMLKGRHIAFTPLMYRQDDSYRTALPLGQNYLEDIFRNFTTGPTVACFPFYSPEISHDTGIFLGINLATRPATPIHIDLFDRDKLKNGNTIVIGQAGSGKSFLLKLLIMRNLLRGVKTVIIDPEGEYVHITKFFEGAVVKIATDTNSKVNPLDLEEEEEVVDGRVVKVVKVDEKIADMLNLIGVMARGLTPVQESIAAVLLKELYTEKGITSDPESLYKETFIDGELRIIKKQMPTLSDFYEKLKKHAEEKGSEEIKALVDTLALFTKGNIYDLFDGETSPELTKLQDAPIICFDVSALEENILRPIGMYASLSWTWEKFAKKMPGVKKCVLMDEAWMALSKNMPGVQYSARYAETFARRIRKRTGVFIVASQNFSEFVDNKEGRAIVTNSAVQVLLGQSPADIDAVKDMFKLSHGEAEYILSCGRGEGLLKIDSSFSTNFYAKAFPAEAQLINFSAVPQK